MRLLFMQTIQEALDFPLSDDDANKIIDALLPKIRVVAVEPLFEEHKAATESRRCGGVPEGIALSMSAVLKAFDRV